MSIRLVACLAVAVTATALNAQLQPDREPKPQDAITAILSAYETHQVVGMNVGHRRKDIDDLILALVRNRRFPAVVDDIVLEGLNSGYQSLLDRYVAGDEVSIHEVRKVWRTSGPRLWGIHDQLIPLVRKINESLSADQRLRVLAGEPAIDWTTMTAETGSAKFYATRDENLAAVMIREVLSKPRKALLLYGTGHLAHGIRDMAVWRYERQYPNVTFVITNQACPGVPPDTPELFAQQASANAKVNEELERRMRYWPTPSLARIRGTWLADLMDPVSAKGILKLPPWSQSFDAYLYLGPAELLLFEPTPAYFFLDAPFITEQRRQSQWGPQQAHLDPAKLVAREANPLFCHQGIGGRFE